MNHNHHKKRLGRTGENVAASHLLRQGYHIVARNWRCRSGEIDIIAERGKELIFVEVSTRTLTGNYGTAAESVHPRKQRQVRETAQVYLHHRKAYDKLVRFDVIAIEFDKDGLFYRLKHFPQAF